jgi:predicted amidophosphoribosyltransferase
MIICSRCGAENKPQTAICRMCANPLGTSELVERRPTEALPEAVSTVVVLLPQENEIRCPACAASNEPDYMFCQKCGTKLSSAPSPAEVKTILEEKSTPQEIAAQSLLSKPPDAFKTTPTGKTINCPNCDNEVVIGSAFCNMCGTRISVEHTVTMASLRSGPKARIRLIVDGEDSTEEYNLGNETIVGRMKGDITFPFDDYMSSKHASIIRRGNAFVLKDEGSRNGTLIKIDGEIELKPGDMFLIGKQLFRFEM